MKKYWIFGFVFLLLLPIGVAEVEDVILIDFVLDHHVMCAGETNQVYLLFENIGRTREEVSVRVESPLLNFQFTDQFRIGVQDDTNRKELFLSFIAPENAPSRSYLISANIGGEFREYVQIRVVDCTQESSTVVFTNIVNDSIESPKHTNFELIGLIVLVNLLVVLLFVSLVLYLKKNKK